MWNPDLVYLGIPCIFSRDFYSGKKIHSIANKNGGRYLENSVGDRNRLAKNYKNQWKYKNEENTQGVMKIRGSYTRF